MSAMCYRCFTARGENPWIYCVTSEPPGAIKIMRFPFPRQTRFTGKEPFCDSIFLSFSCSEKIYSLTLFRPPEGPQGSSKTPQNHEKDDVKISRFCFRSKNGRASHKSRPFDLPMSRYAIKTNGFLILSRNHFSTKK